MAADSDEIEEAVAGAIRVAVTAAAMAVEQAARRRQQLAQDAARGTARDREDLNDRFRVERDAARGELMLTVDQPGWWREATPEQVGRAWQTAETWRGAHTDVERQAQVIQREVQDRWGVDTREVASRAGLEAGIGGAEFADQAEERDDRSARGDEPSELVPVPVQQLTPEQEARWERDWGSARSDRPARSDPPTLVEGIDPVTIPEMPAVRATEEPAPVPASSELRDWLTKPVGERQPAPAPEERVAPPLPPPGRAANAGRGQQPDPGPAQKDAAARRDRADRATAGPAVARPGERARIPSINELLASRPDAQRAAVQARGVTDPRAVEAAALAGAHQARPAQAAAASMPTRGAALAQVAKAATRGKGKGQEADRDR